MFIVKHPGYPFDVLVAIGASDTQVLAKLKRLKVKLTDDDEKNIRDPHPGRGSCTMLEGGQTVMRLDEWQGVMKISDYAHLVHEIFHAVEMLFRRIGIKLCSGSDEAYAYAIAELTKAIMRKLSA